MDEFIKKSNELGRNIIFVQGTGGNTSMKIGDKMYIKSSGAKLSEMNIENGCSCCKYQQLSKFISSRNRLRKSDEGVFLDLIRTSVVENKSGGTPSMEVGFHAILPSKYVIHLHSIYSNIFMCMKNGRNILKKIVSDLDFAVIEFKNPGYELAYHLSRMENPPKLIFLKNHGIIIHGDDLNKCTNLMDLVHQKIVTYLKNKKKFTPFRVSKTYFQFGEYLFPDAAVFSKVDFDSLKLSSRKDILEINGAEAYIIKTIKLLKKEFIFLKEKEVEKIINMQQEKYRLKSLRS